MARTLTEGEKPLDWVGSSKKDFVGFPEPVKDEMGNALGLAQFGGKHPSAKPWKGQGGGVFEVWRIMRETPTARFTRCGSRKQSMCCTPSRKSRPEESRRRRSTSIWSSGG